MWLSGLDPRTGWRTDRPVLVDPDVYQLLQLQDLGPDGSTLEDHLAFIGTVQSRAEACGAALDGFLAAQEVVIPENVGLGIKEVDPEHIELEAAIEGVTDEGQVSQERLLGEITPRVVSVPREGQRTKRVVFPSSVREQLEEISKKRRVEGEDVPRFLENPEAYVPFGLNLEEFSERVKGFRTVVYNSRPYLHVKASQGGWFEGVPGVALEPVHGESEVGTTGQARSEMGPDEFLKLAEQAQREGREYVRHGDGWIRINPTATQQFKAVLGEGQPTGDGGIRIPEKALLDICENLESLEFDLPPIEALGLHRELGSFRDPPVSTRFQGELMPHQRYGYRWLSYLSEKGAGGLLADDMGLGKTIQVLAHLAELADNNALRPSLVVCPKTVIENWKREFSRFLPSVDVASDVGRGTTAEELAARDVRVLSYDTLRRQQLTLGKVDWQCLVCDEAQYAKNPTAQRTVAVKALKSHHRAALTGTPVENGMVEFWCVMDFVRPGLLGSWSDFRTAYEKPLIDADTEDGRKPIVDSLLGNLGTHYLRRLKDEVLDDLPVKTERVIEIPLSPRQLELYANIVRVAHEGGRGAALAAITRLLLVCAHPDSLDARYNRKLCMRV